MIESVIQTYDDVKFIEGVTTMTQEHWQEYFSAAIPNGIVSGFAPLMLNSSSYVNAISDGIVFANGIYANLKTDDGYTEVPANIGSADNFDRLLCVRIYFASGEAQLVAKYQTVQNPGSTYWDTTYPAEYAKFAINEAYCCDRNEDYYDIPLFFQGLMSSKWGTGMDLRRFINPKRVTDPFNAANSSGYYKTTRKIISGNNFYYIAGGSSDINLFLDPVNVPDDCVVTIESHSSARNVKVWLFPAIYDVLNQDAYNPATGSPTGTFENVLRPVEANDWSLSGYIWTYAIPNNHGRYYFNFKHLSQYPTPYDANYAQNYFTVQVIK